MFSLVSLDGKTWAPFAFFALVGVAVWWVWKQMQQQQANADAAAAAANTYGGGAAVTPNANTALLDAMFAGTANQNALPAPGTQATYSAPGQAPPLAQPGASPVTLGNSSNTNGL